MTSTLKDITTIVGAIIALLTLVKAVYEYTRQTTEKRAKQFLDLRTAYRGNPDFQEIAELLLDDNDKLKDTLYIKRFEYMAFFEDIAFLMNSGQIRKEVAYYMFGYDAIAAWDSNKFWNDDLRTSKYWKLMADFVKQMKDIDKTFEYDRQKLSL